ncbi:MAG: peptide chain release factor N(5)-glutamine methyltransferase [Thermodesulfovibrionales bacterium]|nr:peptide chain release factor N(5)-glutamine methyltransferase [Thermodesulfovibrionales bacterium]
MNFLDVLKQTKEYLEKSGMDSPAKEAEIIISHYMNTDRAVLYRDNPAVKNDIVESIRLLSTRRARREPLQYILGSVEFCGLQLKIGQGVLIPRPETEMLVEEAINLLAHVSPHNENLFPHPLSAKRRGWRGNILDLCTGSGCIALALATAFPHAQIWGTDTSTVALEYAKENSVLNNIQNVEFIRGNLFEPLGENRRFDLIISNPPYIKHDDLKNLQPEIRIWEPGEALDGGEDGLDYYRAILTKAKYHLKKEGLIMLEMGIGQADAVRQMAAMGGFIDISLRKDYAGIERILIGKTGMV